MIMSNRPVNLRRIDDVSEKSPQYIQPGSSNIISGVSGLVRKDCKLDLKS